MAGGKRKQYEIRCNSETDIKEAIMNTTPYITLRNRWEM
jgi:hypothetical protein